MHVDHHCHYCHSVTVKIEIVTEKIEKMINENGKDVAELTVHSVRSLTHSQKQKNVSCHLGVSVWDGKLFLDWNFRRFYLKMSIVV